jgi:hypothetical protein
MATRHGFGKVSATDSLVFAYDVNDPFNSYKGMPGQNFAHGPARNNNGYNLTTYTNGKLIESNGYSEVVNIPGLGRRTVQTTEYYNVYSSYGEDGNYNCCPTLFVYAPGGWNTAVWESSTTYTYQIIYRTTSGYTHPNYMYRYEYNSSGTYLTEQGVHTTSLRTHLGEGWYHAWNTFTTQPGASQGYTGLWHYEYNTRNKISIAAVSITKGTNIRPPLQFIDEGTTRSSTGALLDLRGNATMDVSTVSFNSNAQIVFDGTDDYINLPGANWNILTTHTLEGVFKANGTPSGGYHVLFQKEGGYSGGAVYGLRANDLGQIFAMICYDQEAASQNTLGSAISIANGQWYHIAATFDSSYNWKLYVNGELSNQTTLSRNPFQNNSAITIGQGDGRKTNGELPVMKIYNRALTELEVKTNYNQYKTRFGI